MLNRKEWITLYVLLHSKQDVPTELTIHLANAAADELEKNKLAAWQNE